MSEWMRFTGGPVRGAVLVLALASVFGGCSKKEGDKAASQVVARVNGKEISLHQVNHLLAKAGNVPADQLDRVRRSVLDRLIDQELLATKAVEEKLDRTPETIMALDLARREVLAQARMEQLLASTSKLGPGDVTRYYQMHPELFAERQLFQVQELAFPTLKDGLAEVQALVDRKAPVNAIQEWLKSRNIQFAANAGVRAAEQVPADLLKVLHTAKEGDMLLRTHPQGHAVIRVAGIRRVPVDESAAAPAIRRFLVNQRVSETTAAELKALKTVAKIEYLGALANVPKADAPPALATQAPTPAPTAAAAPATPASSGAAPSAGTAPAMAGPLPALPQLDQMPIGMSGPASAQK